MENSWINEGQSKGLMEIENTLEQCSFQYFPVKMSEFFYIKLKYFIQKKYNNSINHVEQP
jgi:hypothetical protein